MIDTSYPNIQPNDLIKILDIQDENDFEESIAQIATFYEVF